MKNIAAVLLMTLVCANLFAQRGALMEGMNPSRTNLSPAPTPVSRPAFEVIASEASGTLKRIAVDGSLILTDGAVLSFYEKTGRLRWRQEIFAVLNGAIVDVAVAPTGAIYASSSNTLIALHSDSGKPIWAQPLVLSSGDESGPLVVDSKGTVYIHTGSTTQGSVEKLTAVDPDGTRKWEYIGRTGRGAGRPVFSIDESTTYLLQPSPFDGGAGTLVGLSAASGEVLFQSGCTTSGPVYAYSSANRIYTGYDGNNLLQFSPELQSCSVVASALIVTDTVAVLNSGLVIVDVALPAGMHSYAAIDSKGQPVWFRVDALAGGFAANLPDGAGEAGEANAMLYAIAPATNELVALRIATGEELWRQKFDAPVSGMLAGTDGNLYLVSGTDLLRSSDSRGGKGTSGLTGASLPLTADTTPPLVSISSPVPNSTVSQTITVSADASDSESGVAGVQFQLDGNNLDVEDTTAPYSVSLDTTTLLNGSHTLTAVARDAAGNRAISTPVTVFTSNPLFDFSLTAPDVVVSQGQSQSTTITATALAGPIEPVSFFVDGLPSGTTGAFSVSSCTPNCTTTLTISTSTSTPPGSYGLTMEGIASYLFNGFVIVIIDSPLNLTVNAVPVLTSIIVTPSSATVPSGAPQQFTATALDQFGVALAPQPSFSWTVSGGGSINSAGLFTAGSTAGGPYTVTASSGGVSGTAGVTIIATPVVMYVQGAGTTNDGSSTSIAQSFTAANASGNLIVAAISWDTNASVTCSDSQSNNYAVATTQYDSAKKQSLAICYAANVKSGSNTLTATFTGSVAYRRLLIHEYQGIALVNPLDVVAKNLANGTTTSNGITSTAAITTASGDLIFGAAMDDAAITTITAGTGFTQRRSVNNMDLATEDLVQVAAGSIAATQTFATADRYLAQMAAFKAAVSVPPNAPPTVATPAAASPNPVTGATTNLSVLGADDAGEANLIYTWATTGTPPAAVTFSANGTNAAKNVVATFTKAGSYTLQVTIKDQGNLTTTSSVSVTVNATLTSISVAPSSATVSTGATQQFNATGADQFGVALAAQPSFSWAVSGGGSISTSGLFTAGGTAGGPFTVTASSGGINGTGSVTVVALNAPPTVATPAAASPNPVTATTTNLSVLGADDAGEANLIYTWATTGTPPAAVTFSANGTNAAKNAVATFAKAGSYTLQVTIKDQGNLTTTSSVSVTVNATLTSISVAPSSATVSTGATQQFNARGADQFGVALAAQPSFSWAVSGGGSINSAGLFTAGTTAGGPFTVTASSGGINGTGSVTVVALNAPPTVATPAAASPNPVTATTTNLSVLGADDGGEANLIYTWATTGTPPAAVTFSANGTNAAKNVVATFIKAGSYTLQVTIKDQGNLTTTSSVSVTVNATLTSISVAPSSATVSTGATQQFTATGADQFGVALAAQPSFSWTVSGGGSINSAGLFTAGSTAGGPFTVTASSGGVSRTAGVTIIATPVVMYVQGAGMTNDGSSTSIAQPFTAANASGNLIVAAISWESNASVACSDSQGNSYVVATTQYDSTDNQSLAICYAANVKSGSNTLTATFTGSVAYRRLLIHEYQGIALANPLDVVANNKANGTTTSNGITSTGAITTASGDLIFGAAMDDAAITTITAGTGFTQRQSVNNMDLATEDLVQVAAGSIAATQTFAAADRYLAEMAAFKAAVSVPPNAPPTVATPAAASPNPVTGTTTNLSVLGADDAGEASLIYTWTTTGTPPAAVTFSANGTNAAKNVVATFAKAGSYTLQVTIKDQGNLTTTSSVSVTVNATLTSISVAPSSATVSTGATQQFTATGADQFGVALAAQPSFSWAVSGGGSISTSGLFTAGGTAGGPYTVTASSGGVSGTAGVTIIAMPVVMYVQGAGTTNDGSSTSIAQSFTAANASGNLIVAAISWESNASVACSDSQGNSYVVATTQYDSTDNQSLAICYAANVKSGSNTLTATFTGSVAYRRLLIHEYQGIALANPLDVMAKNLANGTTTSNGITSTAAITTASGDLIFGAVMDDAAATTITAGTGFTQRQSVNNMDLATEDLVQVAAGSIAATQTFGAPDRYLAQMVAFKHQ
jgi:hypothetical protein